MKRYIPILFILASALTSCEREIVYDGAYEDPKLVLQTVLQEGSTVLDGAVSRSSFFLTDDMPQDRWLDGVTITVQRDDLAPVTYSDTALHMKQGTFRINLTTPLRAGEQIQVSASHPDYTTAQGTDVVVPAPQVTIDACVWDSAAMECRVKLRFADHLNHRGVMGVQGVLNYTMYYAKDDSVDYTDSHLISNNAIFAGQGNSFSTDYGFHSYVELFFSAEDAQGKVVELTMPASDPYFYEGNMSVRLVNMGMAVTSYSEHAYLYRQSLYAYLGLTGSDDFDIGAVATGLFGMEETVQVYTNITDGLGIVEARSQTVLVTNF